MLEVIKQIFPLFSVIILTYLLKYFKVIDKQKLSPSVTQIAFDIVMPVLLFEVFSAAELDFSYLLLPAITIAFSVIAVILILVFSKLKRIDNKLLIFVAFTGLNVAPIYPLVEFNYSTDVFSKFVLMDLGALIILFTLTINIASIGSDVKTKFDIGDALKHIFWNPVMAAIAIGLIVNLLNIKTPDLVLNTTSYISASFGFLVSFIVGLNFELPKEWNIFAKVSLYYLSRVLIAVLFSIIAIAAFSDLQEIKEVVLLILATPFAMLTVVYAEKYKMDSVFAAQLVTFSLFIQILILPVIIWIGRNFI